MKITFKGLHFFQVLDGVTADHKAGIAVEMKGLPKATRKERKNGLIGDEPVNKTLIVHKLGQGLLSTKQITMISHIKRLKLLELSP